MARPKTKTRRFSFSLTDTQWEALDALMYADLATNVGDYVAHMIAELTQARIKCAWCGENMYTQVRAHHHTEIVDGREQDVTRASS